MLVNGYMVGTVNGLIGVYSLIGVAASCKRASRLSDLYSATRLGLVSR